MANYKRKMTDEVILKAEEMMKEGKTTKEITEELHVSKSTLYNNCDMRISKLRGYLYIKLATKLIDKYKTWKNVEEKLGFTEAAIKMTLRGQTQPRKDMIDALLLATGLKYEEAFKEE